MGMEGDYRKEMAEAEAELKYLRWFKIHADFGPADGDVHQMLDEQYEEDTGNQVPKNWRNEE
jgi:outer membrane protease